MKFWYRNWLMSTFCARDLNFSYGSVHKCPCQKCATTKYVLIPDFRENPLSTRDDGSFLAKIICWERNVLKVEVKNVSKKEKLCDTLWSGAPCYHGRSRSIKLAISDRGQSMSKIANNQIPNTKLPKDCGQIPTTTYRLPNSKYRIALWMVSEQDQNQMSPWRYLGSLKTKSASSLTKNNFSQE